MRQDAYLGAVLQRSAAQLGTFRTRVKILWPLLVYIPCLFLDRLAAALGCQVSSVHGEQYGF